MRLPKILTPRSIVRLVRAADNRRDKVGKQYRIGYYSPGCGLEVIWLVDDTGKYIETTDSEDFAKHFIIERMSDETDYYGKHSSRIPARRSVATPSRRFLPPLTLLKLKTAVKLMGGQVLIKDQVGQIFRIGYYSPNDGLEIVWIVNEDGNYIGTITQDRLRKYFRVIKISDELNYCGLPPIPTLPVSQRLEALRLRNI